MKYLYNTFINIYGMGIKVAAMFNPKAKYWVDGRKGLLKNIKESVDPQDKPIWFHAASLGEFEQGRPVIELMKKMLPNKKILLTFYSPSGYEIRKNYDGVDWVYYLALDTKSNADKFIEYVNPSIAIFIKYEFWANMINALHKNNVNTIVISAIFLERQIFFKSYGAWMREVLHKFSMLFVQDSNSVELLKSIDIHNVIKSGDTRFDRVLNILNENNSLEFIANFKQSKKLLVAGSTWDKDDLLLIKYINEVHDDIKIVIAPHNINGKYNKNLLKKINKRAILYSDINDSDISKYDVLILDTVGILTRVYSYADIAFVGGGLNSGIHNILEPAVFSIPVIIGPKFQKFREAVELNRLNGVIVINNFEDFNLTMKEFNNKKLYSTGKVAFDYIKSSGNTAEIICKYIMNVIS